MNKIKIMDENLSNKIAAGEVVERVSNVVKELVENSIDAKANIIKIELIDSGTKLIKITDDGDGMTRKDAKNAFLRHATSKIYTEDDLFFISSLGFRGEALPSIASVSKVTLTTSEGEIGTKIELHGGKLIKDELSDARKGTTIEVKDLFYNVPARLKYLKSDQSELASVVNFIEKLALSKSDISFELINNDNIILKTTGSNNLLKTIHEIYGLSTTENMLPINGLNDDFEVNGYISNQTILKSTRNYITTIVNDRVVKNFNLNKAINDAYHTYKPDSKFPVIVIKINTDPTLIDVNIHPTKQDIKFSKTKSLEDLVFDLIKDALYKNILIPNIKINKEEKTYEEIKMQTKEVKEEQTSFDFKEKNKKIKKIELYPAGLVFGTYIVAQNDEGMYLIDQHAAEERINYEIIKKALKEDIKQNTNMLIPITIELNSSDYIKFNEHKNILENMGFEIEDFGINTILVKAHPTWILNGFEEETTREIIEMVINISSNFDLEKFNDHAAATAACKRSIKGNMNITISEMENILEKLVLCDNPYNCPHGRPTIISFTRYELEKMFKRVM